MAKIPAKTAGAFTFVALVLPGGLIGGVVVNLILPIPVWHGVWIQLIGAAPLAVGIWLFAWSTVTFRRHRTSPIPWRPTVELVQDGPYKYTRNPIYLAYALLYLSASFIFNSAYILVMLLLVVVLFDRTQVPREERYLQEQFGEEFSRYKAKVRRWI